MAEEKACHLLDAAEVLASSDVDGLHLELEGQIAPGQRLAGGVRAILESE
jgi:hypothetical protein